jgi:proteasome lid subunit RPN8/RPN11
MTRLTVGANIIEKTVAYLRPKETDPCEAVVLWLGRNHRVTEVFKPLQVVTVDSFRIPFESMRQLMAHLRLARQRVIAQVHTHPGLAFHSEADDEWSIVRHEGAFSLVLPYFARSTDSKSFLSDAAVYRLNAVDRWTRIEPPDGIIIAD